MPEEKHENLHKELDLIQAVISRMSQNSFLVKGWSITLVSILLTLGKDHLLTTAKPTWLLTLALVVWGLFWYLDAYFLHSERLFRKLYAYVVANPDDETRIRYTLDVELFKPDEPFVRNALFSTTLKAFYGIPAGLMVGLWIYFLSL